MGDLKPENYLEPDFSRSFGQYVHDWRRYTTDEIEAIWGTFTPDQKRVIAEALQEIADMENWD